VARLKNSIDWTLRLCPKWYAKHPVLSQHHNRTRKSVTRTYQNNYNEVYGACRKALVDLNISVEYSNRERGSIIGVTSFSFFSWGEEVQIKVRQKKDNKIEVTVSSDTKAQLFDWGKNKANEVKIISRVSSLLKTR